MDIFRIRQRVDFDSIFAHTSENCISSETGISARQLLIIVVRQALVDGNFSLIVRQALVHGNFSLVVRQALVHGNFHYSSETGISGRQLLISSETGISAR